MNKLRQLKFFIQVLNDFHTSKYNTDFKLNTNSESLQKYYNGLLFLIHTLWKIYLISNLQHITNLQKVQLITYIPDPTGNRFINLKLAAYLLSQSKKLCELFNRKQIGGNINLNQNEINRINGMYILNNFDKITTFLISPISVLEDNLGSVISVPLEICTMYLTIIGTFTQLLSSTLEMLPPMPGVSAGIATIADILQIVHIFTNSFNMFLNIGRGNWDIVIRNGIGMFPQFLEIINSTTMTLNSINKFLDIFNNSVTFLNKQNRIIVPMILPIIKNPLSFMNPFYMKRYIEYQVKNYITNVNQNTFN